MSEYYAALAYSVARLKSVTPNAYGRGAVQGKTPPYLTYELVGESYTSFAGGEIGQGRFVLTVFGVGKGSPAQMKTLLSDVREVLHLEETEQEGYYVSSREIRPLSLPPYYINGEVFYEVGAEYRILTSKAG